MDAHEHSATWASCQGAPYTLKLLFLVDEDRGTLKPFERPSGGGSIGPPARRIELKSYFRTMKAKTECFSDFPAKREPMLNVRLFMRFSDLWHAVVKVH